MKKKSGQIQTENMLIVGLVIFASLILLYFMTQQISETHKMSKVEDALRLLSDKVDALMALSTGSRDVVVIDLPKGVLSTFVSGHRIMITMSKEGTVFNFSKRTSASLIGELSSTEGLHHVPLQKVNDTLVLIGNAPILFSLKPSCIRVSQTNEGVLVTMSGVGFQSGASVLKDGAVYAGSVNVIDDKTITFVAGESFGHVGTSAMSVRNPTEAVSNTLAFEVKGGETYCEGAG